MQATEELKKEHRAIEMMLRILSAVDKKIEAGEKIPQEHLEKIVEFIRVFADQCHHGKEEDLLFPAMEEAGMPRDGGPLAVMLQEHNNGRDYVKAMSEAVISKDLEKFRENAEAYADLLDQHIDKEDNVLYPMADNCLSANKNSQLMEQFAQVEEEKIGAGKHEEFHQLLRDLEKIYLG